MTPKPSTGSRYCVAAGDGSLGVKPELLMAPALDAEYRNWATKAQALLTPLANMREALLSQPAAHYQLKQLLNDTESSFQELKNLTVPLLQKIPAAYRSYGQSLVTNYFMVANSRLQLEQMAEPYKWGINEIRTKYALDISPQTEKLLFGSGAFTISATDVDLVSSDGQDFYRIALSGETTFHGLVRAAARSPWIGDANGVPKKAYLETVRCILSKGILGKYAINKTILDRGDLGQPVPNDQVLCLGTKAADFMELAKRDADFSRESLLRAEFSNSVPNFWPKVSKETDAFIMRNSLAKLVGTLAGFPQQLATINSNRINANEPTISAGDFNNAFAEIDRLINAEYVQHRPFEAMRAIWRSPRILASLNDMMSGCVRFPDIPNLDHAPTVADFIPNLIRGDDTIFMTSLAADSLSMPGRWLGMDRAQLTNVLRSYIIDKKVESSLRALTDLLDMLSSESTANTDQLLAASYEDLSKTFTDEYTRIWMARPELQKWLDGVVDKIDKERDSVNTFQKMAEGYTADLLQGAKVVAKIMDPNTLPSQLPYTEKHVLNSLAGSIKQLSPVNRARYDALTNEMDPVKRNKLWQEHIRKDLMQEAAQKGATCDKDPGSWERTKNLFGSWVSSGAAEARMISRDCKILRLIAAAIGANGTEKLTSMADTVFALQASFDADEVQEFMKSYRERLASSEMEKNRLLDFPIDGSGETKLWQKMVQVNNAQALIPDVMNGLKFSVANLDGYLKTVANAKSEKDLMFFIKDTNVINVVLGQPQIDQDQVLSRINPTSNGQSASRILSADDVGFVFPNLLTYHQSVQKKAIQDEDLKQKVWSEFVDSNMNVAYAVIGGWFAKSVLGILPRALALPYAASAISKGGGRISPMIGGHANYTMLILVGNAARLWSDKRDFDAELGGIKTLRVSEGVSMMADSPFSLITDDDYFKQKIYFEEASKNARDEIVSTIEWLAIPTAISVGMARYYGSGIRMLREGREANLAVGRASSNESWLRFKIYNKKNLLSVDLALLGNPEITIDQLRIARDLKLKSAKGAYHRRLINEAYNNIVTAFGSDIEVFYKLPRMQQAYARALYGNNGSSSQLIGIYNEYRNLTRGGLQ